jgi:DNA-binding GntR family transcriptional regulator
LILGRRVTRSEKRYKSETKLLVEKLREAIVAGKLTPGEPLSETELAASFKVGPAALREALRALEGQGFVTFRPDNEIIVSKPSRQEIEDHYAIAGALEGLAARLAVERAQPGEVDRLRELHQALKEACQQRDAGAYFDTRNEFHRLIADMARSERLYRMLEQLGRDLRKTRPLSMRMPQRFESSMRDHDQILDAFIKKNPELAAAAVIRHLNNQVKLLNDESVKGAKP